MEGQQQSYREDIADVLYEGDVADQKMMQDVLELLSRDSDEDGESVTQEDTSSVGVYEGNEEGKTEQITEEEGQEAMNDDVLRRIQPLTDDEFVIQKRKMRAKEASRRYRKRQQDCLREQKREIKELEGKRDRLQYELNAASKRVGSSEGPPEQNQEVMLKEVGRLLKDMASAMDDESKVVTAVDSVINREKN